MKSTFTADVEKEQMLFPLLDAYYHTHVKYYNTQRVYDFTEQMAGIDVIFTHKTTHKHYYIDEKAQIDYINETLPTFAFELGYLKNDTYKEGWLFNNSKKTHFYALVTSIFKDEPKAFTSCKITLVNRKKLCSFLANKQINTIYNSWSAKTDYTTHGKIVIPALNPKTEGYLYYSKNNKREQPLNLILRLDFLIAKGMGKKLV